MHRELKRLLLILNYQFPFALPISHLSFLLYNLSWLMVVIKIYKCSKTATVFVLGFFMTWLVLVEYIKLIYGTVRCRRFLMNNSSIGLMEKMHDT